MVCVIMLLVMRMVMVMMKMTKVEIQLLMNPDMMPLLQVRAVDHRTCYHYYSVVAVEKRLIVSRLLFQLHMMLVMVIY